MPGNSEIENSGCLEVVKKDIRTVAILLILSALITCGYLSLSGQLLLSLPSNGFSSTTNGSSPRSRPSSNSNESWINPYPECEDWAYLLLGEGCR